MDEMIVVKWQFCRKKYKKPWECDKVITASSQKLKDLNANNVNKMKYCPQRTGRENVIDGHQQLNSPKDVYVWNYWTKLDLMVVSSCNDLIRSPNQFL
jgi:hypothetical protein